MAASVLVDAGFLVALLNHREKHHGWAAAQARRTPPPWRTCEAVLSEAFYVLGSSGTAPLGELVEQEAVLPAFNLAADVRRIVQMMAKYKDVPMSLADACLVRMTEVLPDPVLLTTDTDFTIYRRHGRHLVPAVMPR